MDQTSADTQDLITLSACPNALNMWELVAPYWTWTQPCTETEDLQIYFLISREILAEIFISKPYSKQGIKQKNCKSIVQLYREF